MKGYRINQAQLNQLYTIVSASGLNYAKEILDSLELLERHSTVQKQSDKRAWPITITAKAVREGTYP